MSKVILGSYFAPVLSTLRLPNCFFAVTSQAIKLVARPRTGDNAAAIMFWWLQSRVKEAGSTAEDTITPIRRYRYPSDIPIIAIVSSLMRLLFERRMVAVQLHTDVI
jgi:hypothetical protein